MDPIREEGRPKRAANARLDRIRAQSRRVPIIGTFVDSARIRLRRKSPLRLLGDAVSAIADPRRTDGRLCRADGRRARHRPRRSSSKVILRLSRERPAVSHGSASTSSVQSHSRPQNVSRSRNTSRRSSSKPSRAPFHAWARRRPPIQYPDRSALRGARYANRLGRGVARGDLPTGDGNFEFNRTVSRLIEMQSADYVANGPRR